LLKELRASVPELQPMTFKGKQERLGDGDGEVGHRRYSHDGTRSGVLDEELVFIRREAAGDALTERIAEPSRPSYRSPSTD
jgi:hypothetical protein